MPTNRRIVEDTPEGNAYATPLWATQLLLDAEGFEGPVWECCAGGGHISKVLLDNGYVTYSSDLYPYPRVYDLNADHKIYTPIDALQVKDQIDNIVTNPPYSDAEEFVRMCNRLAKKKFALLLRLAFLEGAERCTELFSEIPPTYVYVMADRVSMYPMGDVRTSGGTTAYAWYVFDKTIEYKGTELRWLYYDKSKDNRYPRPTRGRKSKKTKVVTKEISHVG